MNTVEDFWTYVQKGDGCWMWTGPILHGYGLFHFGSKRFRAHRFAWEIANGPIPADMCVCHRCDTPACVNPGHLFLGTQLDNIADRVEKGRSAKLVGESNGYHKLTEQDVREIRTSPMSQRQAAKAYGVSQPMIGLIRRREKWKHI